MLSRPTFPMIAIAGLLILGTRVGGAQGMPESTRHVELRLVNRGKLEIARLPEELLDRFTDECHRSVETRPQIPWVAVRLGSAKPGGSNLGPPLWGTWKRRGTLLSFEPRFPFRPGIPYTVFVRDSSLGDRDRELELPFVVPVSDRRYSPTDVPRCLQIYPTSSTLPRNQLKLYLVFSTPMRIGNASERIRLVRLSTGEPVEDAFLRIDRELWDPTGKRMTLFFDPGRLKRGVEPHEALGYPLIEGEPYRLEVDPGWVDARGRRLVEGFSKEFLVTSEDRESPSLSQWRVIAPRSGTREPLELQLDESLDFALLHRVLIICDPKGARVEGSIGTSDQERRWSFVPQAPWGHGPHEIRIDSWLEDLAGNNLARPFEIDVEDAHGNEETTEASKAHRIFFVPTVEDDPTGGARPTTKSRPRVDPPEIQKKNEEKKE